MIFHKIHIFLKYQSLGNFRIKSLILPQREQQKNYVQWIRHIFYILECKWEKVNCRAWASSIKEIHKEEEWNGTTTLESVKSRDMGLYLSSSFFLLSLLSAEDLNSAPLVWPPVKIIMHSANVLQMGRRLDFGPRRYTLRLVIVAPVRLFIFDHFTTLYALITTPLYANYFSKMSKHFFENIKKKSWN